MDNGCTTERMHLAAQSYSRKVEQFCQFFCQFNITTPRGSEAAQSGLQLYDAAL